VLWVLLLLRVAVGLVVALAVGRRRGNDRDEGVRSGVESFRRHMDALSPEARRAVIDRVRAARDRSEG